MWPGNTPYLCSSEVEIRMLRMGPHTKRSGWLWLQSNITASWWVHHLSLVLSIKYRGSKFVPRCRTGQSIGPDNERLVSAFDDIAETPDVPMITHRFGARLGNDQTINELRPKSTGIQLPMPWRLYLMVMLRATCCERQLSKGTRFYFTWMFVEVNITQKVAHSILASMVEQFGDKTAKHPKVKQIGEYLGPLT